MGPPSVLESTDILFVDVMRLKYFVISVFAVFLIGSVSAVLEIGNLSHSIDVNSGILGFKISGNFEDISSFSLNIISDTPASNNPQLYIDVFNDGVIEWQAHSPSGGFGPEIFGC